MKDDVGKRVPVQKKVSLVENTNDNEKDTNDGKLSKIGEQLKKSMRISGLYLPIFTLFRIPRRAVLPFSVP